MLSNLLLQACSPALLCTRNLHRLAGHGCAVPVFRVCLGQEGFFAAIFLCLGVQLSVGSTKGAALLSSVRLRAVIEPVMMSALYSSRTAL